jgi:hypothetical protein
VTASGLPIVVASGAASGGRLASSYCHAGGTPCPRTSFGAPGSSRPTVLPIVFDCPLSVPYFSPFLHLSPSYYIESPFLKGNPKMDSFLNPPVTMYLRPLSFLFYQALRPLHFLLASHTHFLTPLSIIALPAYQTFSFCSKSPYEPFLPISHLSLSFSPLMRFPTRCYRARQNRAVSTTALRLRKGSACGRIKGIKVAKPLSHLIHFLVPFGTIYINSLKFIRNFMVNSKALFHYNRHYYLLVVLPTLSNHIGLVLSSHPASLFYPRTESTLGTRDTLTILYYRV